MTIIPLIVDFSIFAQAFRGCVRHGSEFAVHMPLSVVGVPGFYSGGGSEGRI